MTTAPTFASLGSEVDPLLGRLINDRYKVTEAIGHGGMGRVYKALQTPLDRVVALKVLGAGHDRDPNFYKRFFLEASVTAKLTHPNTITLFDYGRTDDGIFFIAMEFLTGRTLSQAMQQEGPMAQERVVHIAQQICRSLREAHALGIIHRDMKPANVMLLRQQDDHDFVKVLDFGLVKFFSGDNPEGEITNAGTFMGSPHYIAPEQARNQNPDQRCDIYSLGVLMYHMLTGKVPFTAPNPVDIILKHLHDPPVPPRELKPELDIDLALQDVVLKCLAKDREGRFQSMDELLAQLKLVRSYMTGNSGPQSMPPPADTLDGMRPISLNMLNMQNTPPSMRTPSGPMPAMRTPVYGSPAASYSQPPPPPADDDSGPGQASGPRSLRVPGSDPAFAAVLQKRSLFRPSVVLPVLLFGGAAGGIAWLRSGTLRETASASPSAAAVQAPLPSAASIGGGPLATVPAPAGDKVYPTALAGTTLVSVSSNPSGAEVHDVDDRLLGTTPFELAVPSQKPLLLTLRRDGYKPYTLRQRTVNGERLSLTGTLKKDPKADLSKADLLQGSKRSVGYKDDPY